MKTAMQRLKCFFGFHKWKYEKWLIERSKEECRRRLYVKYCTCYPCKAIKKVSTLEGIKKVNHSRERKLGK